jgi:hypothetical protein
MLGFRETRLVKISTPFAKAGVIFDDFQRHFRTDSRDVLVWRAPSSLMNPAKIKAAELDRLQLSASSRESLISICG